MNEEMQSLLADIRLMAIQHPKSGKWAIKAFDANLIEVAGLCAGPFKWEEKTKQILERLKGDLARRTPEVLEVAAEHLNYHYPPIEVEKPRYNLIGA